jgi:hypothetical protein
MSYKHRGYNFEYWLMPYGMTKSWVSHGRLIDDNKDVSHTTVACESKAKARRAFVEWAWATARKFAPKPND